MAARSGIDTEPAFESLMLELRRGSLVLAVLQSLSVEMYGYTLRSKLVEAGIAIDEGTLYPLLRRLESQGLLTSEWRDDDKRRKRFYVLSTEGKRVLIRLVEEWRALNTSVESLLNPSRRTHARASRGGVVR